MKKTIAGSLIIICIFCLFSSCGLSKSELYGNWYSDVENIRFDENGTGYCIDFDNYGNIVLSFSFTWTLNNSTLILKVGDTTTKYTVAFSGNNLQITNGYGVTTTYSR